MLKIIVVIVKKLLRAFVKRFVNFSTQKFEESKIFNKLTEHTTLNRKFISPRHEINRKSSTLHLSLS